MKRYERYKSSNVEWIGEIPEHWQTIKIKYSTYVKGRVGWNGLTSSEFLIDGYSYLVTGTDFKDGLVDWEKCYYIDQERYEVDPFIQLKENDLLITKDGTIGKTALVKSLDKPACLNSGIFVTRPLNGVYITPFMYWILNSFEFKKFFDFTSRGSTILHLYQNVFEDFIFAYPDIDEQKVIANYLDKKTTEIEELIADKVNLISLLEQEKELTISNAVSKGLNPNVPMKDTKVKWIGEIPKHWEIKKIKYIFTSFDNKRVPLSADERGKMSQRIYDYYGASGVIDKVESYIFDGDYLLIGEDGANLLDRNSDLVFKASGKFWVNNHAHILQPIKNDIDFYIYYLENLDFTMWISGSAQPKLTADALNNIRVSVPPIIEQQQIVEYLDKKIAETNETVQIIKDEIELLKEYKETLIYEVITGKIDVRGCNETH